MAEKKDKKKPLMPLLPPHNPPGEEAGESIERELRLLELARERLRASMIKTALELDAKRRKDYIV